jgi:catechol 2,3-dioxygenase-like lactoylglutathione lyase family enzyme
MKQSMSTPTVKKLTPNLIVDSIEECLEFWVGRLGFEKTTEVPDGKQLGFVILQRGKVELMLQSRASLKKDVAPLADAKYQTVVYCEVPALAPLRKALEGYPEVVPERTTFYGAREIIVRDPAGNVVFLAEHG